jgi:multidrug efflux system membrane fusion protein
MKTRLLLAALILIAAMTAACIRKEHAAVEPPRAVAGVKIEQLTLAAVDDSFEAVGTVRARTVSALSSKIVGSVIAMRVREGDRVRAGQTLVEIDNRETATHLLKAQAGQREAEQGVEEIDRSIRAAEAAKTASEANLTLAAITLSRYQKLLERSSVSQQEFDEVQTRHKVAEAEVERAARMLQSLEARRNQVLARIAQAKADVSGAQVVAGYAKITSPINGIVTAKSADIGAMAAPGVPLVTVEDNSQYRLEVAVEESRITSVRLNDNVRVRIDAISSDEIAGRVVEVAPTADPASRSYTVKIEMTAAGHTGNQRLLRSGLYGKARFVTGQKQALTIARAAVVERGQLVGVYVIDANGIARLRLIQTGKTFNDRVEVLSGLSDGERIAIDHIEALNDGSKVN